MIKPLEFSGKFMSKNPKITLHKKNLIDQVVRGSNYIAIRIANNCTISAGYSVNIEVKGLSVDTNGHMATLMPSFELMSLYGLQLVNAGIMKGVYNDLNFMVKSLKHNDSNISAGFVIGYVMFKDDIALDYREEFEITFDEQKYMQGSDDATVALLKKEIEKRKLEEEKKKKQELIRNKVNEIEEARKSVEEMKSRKGKLSKDSN